MNGEILLRQGKRQLAEWAQSWVENETGIHEAGSASLSDKEKAGLMLIAMILEEPQ